MAAAIEAELNAMLLAAGLPLLPADAERRDDHRRLFVAIARGVVGHMKANQSSIQITYDDDGSTETATTNLSVTGI
jgi:hypothetical protein